MKRGRERHKFGSGDREKLSVKHSTDERMEDENVATEKQTEGSTEQTTDKVIETKSEVENNDDENTIGTTSARSADQNTDQLITPKTIQKTLLGKNDNENTVVSTIARTSSKDKDDTSTMSLTTEKTPEKLMKQLLDEAKTGKFYNVQEILTQNTNLTLDTQDQMGKTVLHYICTAGNLKTLKVCLERKPDLNITDKTGWTALHWAAVKGHVDVIEELINYGVDVNVPDSKLGQTALHLAVRRNQRESVNMLLSLGANAQKLDKEGKSCVHESQNEHMKQNLHDHIQRCQDEKDTGGLGGVETKTIQYGCSESFPSVGIEIYNKTEITSQLILKGLQLACQRLPVDKVDPTLFDIAEKEDVCSDVFMVKCGESETPKIIDIIVPFSSRPNMNEEIVVKTDARQEIAVENLKIIKDKLNGTFEGDVSTFLLFVAVCRPKKEVFRIGKEAAVLKSVVDERVEMEIPKGTFQKPVEISMEITEPPSKTELGQSKKEHPDVLSLTSFYSLEAQGGDLTKSISLKVPLPTDFKGNGQMVVFSSDSPEDETPESWTPLETEASIINDRIEFSLSSFSIKVAIELIVPSRAASSKSRSEQFGSMTSLRSRLSDISTLSQVSSLYKQARRREYTVSLLVFSKRQGHSNIFRLVAECCRKENVDTRRSHWANEGFEEHGNFSDLPTISVVAKQKFKLKTTGNIAVVGDKGPLLLEFHRKLESVVATKIKVLGDSNDANGFVVFEKMERQQKNDSSDLEEEYEGDIVCKVDIKLKKFDRSMIREKTEIDEFLNVRFLDDLQEIIGNNWDQILILMGVGFQHIEETLKEKTVHLHEKISRLFIEWKGENEDRREKGLPVLLSALCKGGLRGLANTIQIDLKKWHTNKKSINLNPFYNWVSECYKRKASLVLCDYPEPLSDAFLVLVFSDIQANSELCTRLDIRETLFAEVSNQPVVYLNESLKTMKILVEFCQAYEGNKTAAIEELLKVLGEMGLIDQRRRAIENLKGWLNRAATINDDYKRQIQCIVNTEENSRQNKKKQ